MPKKRPAATRAFPFRAPEADRARFEAAAKAERLSLNQWLVTAALEKLRRDRKKPPL